jgi:hypothetical protein
VWTTPALQEEFDVRLAVVARSTPMVLTCMWTTPSGDSLFNDHPLAHSMPGAGVVHYIKSGEVQTEQTFPVCTSKQT